VVDSLLAVVGLLLLVGWTAAGLRYYLPVARYVWVKGAGKVETSWVGGVDVAVAIVLVLWFSMLGQEALLDSGPRVVEFRHIVSGVAIYGAILLLLVGLLVYRNFRLGGVFGWDRLGFGGSLGRGVVALLAAYPVLMLVQAMVYGVAGGDLAPQDVVQFLQNAETPRDRLSVLVMAVVVAPVAEEVIFRGYLYPIGKTRIGSFLSLVATSLLFAVLHGHMASIPALFTLAMCLGLAYEKTGSLLVPMIMHAIFNAVSVTAILFLM
jgi:membrane protease YdiL (CAAX protease family)